MRHVMFIIWFLWATAFFEAAGVACSQVNTDGSGFGVSDAGKNTGPLQVAVIETQECATEYRIGLSGGQNLSGARRLSDGAGHFITYFLWKDTGANLEWGTNSISADIPYSADPLIASGTGAAESHFVVGTALTAGPWPPGVYEDLVRVILFFSPYGSTDILETDLFLSLTIRGNCTLDLNGLNGFGVWPVGPADLQNVPLGVLTVNCTAGMSFAIGMDSGQNWQDGFRNMRCGSHNIPYTIFIDSSGAPWGDAGLSAIEPNYTETNPYPAQYNTTKGTSQNFYIWGDAQINGKPAGIYTDLVNITVVWP